MEHKMADSEALHVYLCINIRPVLSLCDKQMSTITILVLFVPFSKIHLRRRRCSAIRIRTRRAHS